MQNISFFRQKGWTYQSYFFNEHYILLMLTFKNQNLKLKQPFLITFRMVKNDEYLDPCYYEDEKSR